MPFHVAGTKIIAGVTPRGRRFSFCILQRLFMLIDYRLSLSQQTLAVPRIGKLRGFLIDCRCLG